MLSRRRQTCPGCKGAPVLCFCSSYQIYNCGHHRVAFAVFSLRLLVFFFSYSSTTFTLTVLLSTPSHPLRPQCLSLTSLRTPTPFSVTTSHGASSALRTTPRPASTLRRVSISWLFWRTAACQLVYQLAAAARCSPSEQRFRTVAAPSKAVFRPICIRTLTSQPRRRTTSLVRCRRSSRIS